MVSDHTDHHQSCIKQQYFDVYGGAVLHLDAHEGRTSHGDEK